MEAMEILHEIVAADKAARERCRAAAEERDSFDQRLESLGRQIGDSMMDSAHRDVDEARRKAETDAAEALEALDREFREAADRLRRDFAARKDVGVETLFRMVVGLDD